MMRVVVWIAVSLALASAQERSDAGVKPVPVEASAGIRNSFAGCREPEIRDVLPDPVKYPQLHAAEVKKAQEYYRLAQISEYPCYNVEPGYDSDRVQPLLDTLSTSASLQSTASGERFWPQKIISWGKGKQVRRVAWSTKTNEVVFLEGGKRLRYRLTPEAVKHLRTTVGDMRVMRPDALEEAAPSLNALKEGAKMTIYEGLPRLPLRDNSGDEALKRRGEWLVGGFQFFKTGTVDRETGVLRNLLLKEEALLAWRGQKFCGAFHPDFAITWKMAESDVSLMVCLTCHEAIFTSPAGDLLYDLPTESYEALKAELEKFRPVPAQLPSEK